jgi:hypothetical protein
MSEPLDLSTLKTDKPGHVDAEDGQGPHAEAEGTDNPEQVPVVGTAFLVYEAEGGHWVASTDLLNKPLVVRREASADDFYHAVCDIKRDIDSSSAASAMIAMMQQQAQAAMAAQQNQQILQAMKGGAGMPGGP